MTEFQEPFVIKTTIQRSWYSDALTEVEVTCATEDGIAAGELKGFLLKLGYFPDEDDLDGVSFLDDRSGHAHETFLQLAKHSKLIARRLGMPSDEFSEFVHIEEIRVDPKYRGHKLGLRMLHEARYVLSGVGRLASLKAHPMEIGANGGGARKLAAYYSSDKKLGFKSLAPRGAGGWLVADWYDEIRSDYSPIWEPEGLDL